MGGAPAFADSVFGYAEGVTPIGVVFGSGTTRHFYALLLSSSFPLYDSLS